MQLALLNDFIWQAISEIRLSPPELLRFRLAVEEAVVNCILYAYPGETGREIVINLAWTPGRLTVVIIDYGVAFDPTTGKDPDLDLPLDERPVGGLGRYLTKKLMSQVMYTRESGRNILTLIKELERDARL
jgi:anti-sigma regulatory factor (Ser/Thr protein kinase)